MKKENYQHLVEEIHNEAIIIDAHFDLLYDVAAQRELGRKQVIETDHLPNFVKGGWNIIVSSIYLDDSDLPEMALRKALNQVSCLYSEIEESPDKIMLCKNTEDILHAKQSGKIGIMLSFEGVEPLGTDVTLLRVFYELGVRMIGLTWSRRNAAGDGCTFNFSDRAMTGGITDFGLSVIEEAERLGMVMDVTHINDQGFSDIINHSHQPVVASHSNARTIANTPRNLTNDQLRALADSSGVAGINAVSIIAVENSENATIEKLVDHIEHMIKVVGIDHVGLGLDLCDLFNKYSSPEEGDKLPHKSFDILGDHGELSELTYALLGRGFKKEEVLKIYGGNMLRVYRKTFG
ncbi:membrane dipeptidase [Virgibacillus profundi]|uniref:Membrane dipeptidase n=1 Tax=Virgibacillus profundi TaxID=2024555 RepID=A0A2A2IH33_9BACI|nr:dipeptidase [Virgibacillus profundi]PAV31311.1 membrane dipeptidase [Virgibacillus profundi]PXY55496.1 membrane dipeptidase [Virgibacillus profundi]